MNERKKISVLTGAGMSAESGLRTFRDNNGLWEEYNVMEVATPEAWRRDMDLVLRFYNERRAQLKSAVPNEGHLQLVRLEEKFETVIITQNVDDLHEKAGSTQILHLHGELNKSRSTFNPSLIYPCTGDIRKGDKCEKGSQLRPHIVWFGEAVPMLERAIVEVAESDVIIIIGTSMQVYPAASLVGYAPPEARVLYIDPNPQINYELQHRRNLEIFQGMAGVKVKEVVDALLTTS